MRIATIFVLMVLFAGSACATDVVMVDDCIHVLGTPSDGRVYRMDLDVTGDGVPEIFIGVFGGHAWTWVVYTNLSGGKYRELPVQVRPDAPADYDLTQLVFSYDAFYYDGGQALLAGFVRGGPGEGGWTRYHVSSTGFAELTDAYDPGVQESKAADWKMNGRPPLYWTTLDQLKGSAPVWKRFFTDEVQPSLGRLDAIVVR